MEVLNFDGVIPENKKGGEDINEQGWEKGIIKENIELRVRSILKEYNLDKLWYNQENIVKKVCEWIEKNEGIYPDDVMVKFNLKFRSRVIMLMWSAIGEEVIKKRNNF